MVMAEFQIWPINSEDREWVTQFISERWGAEFIVAHGKVYHPRDLQGFVAITNAKRAGLITYVIEQDDCEIVSLDSLEHKKGIGTALVEAVKKTARERGCERVWLTTTNDNLNALRFYQKRGFALVTIHRNAIEMTRRYKPVPLTGGDDIPIRDEIELELMMED
jgi:GNAT superfamily N-acetyltransferase